MQVGVGYSDIPDSAIAGKQAVDIAIEQAGRVDKCDIVLIFCTARHESLVLRDAISSVVGDSVPIFGGGAVGIITNETFGYAGDQVGVACIWLDGVKCNVLTESGLSENEENTGIQLGKKLAEAGTEQDSSVMMFYDAVDHSKGELRLLMATWLLEGMKKGLGFLPNLMGAGLQGDHICSPTSQYIGDGLGEHSAMAMTFSKDIFIDSAIMHGCKPASPYYTVTRADGPAILEINNQPALKFLDNLLGSAITPEEYPFFLILGINHGNKWEAYDENNYASRLCLGIDRKRDCIIMFEPDMIAGTEFQIMFRSMDYDYMKPKVEELFDRLDGREPVFAMYIDCAGRCAGYGGMDLEDAVVIQEAVNSRVPLLGLYTGVEIAAMGGRPRGLDWTGVFCLFSRNKAGSTVAQTKNVSTWENAKTKPASDEITIDAVLKLCEQNAAKVLALDTQSIAIRHELEQKRRGFRILAELTTSLKQEADYDKVFLSVAKRMNSALNMQKTIVLVPDNKGLYTPTVLHGFTESEKSTLANKSIKIGPELLNAEIPLLLTAEDTERLMDLRKTFALPNLIATPVSLQNEVVAVLITGRMVEQPPFLLRLSPDDVETVQAIGALMASALLRQRLDDAEERAHIMLDTAPLCANFWDENLNNIDCNQEAVKLFDLSNKQEYLNRFYELSPEFQPNGRRSDELALQKIKKAFSDGICVFEWMHQKLNGEQIPSEITLVRVRYKDSDVVVGYTRDLRELKAKMAEIERTQEDLREARDRAEESARAKSNFLANMSHEIRTPMNAIIGMTEIAKDSEDLERVKYCLGKIDDASAHLLGIINDILDMSKIDAGRFSLSVSDFSLESMLQRVTSVINFKIDEKKQNFIIKVDKDVPASIIADKQRLIQVMTNLLSNAVKFTPEEGTISLLVHKAEEKGDNCTLHIEVQDTGIGISESQKAKLFQSFQQADGSISRRFGGTGLGLAISKNIVELMGGSIWVDSEPQTGSNFQFTVQVKKGTAKALNKLDRSIDWKNLKVLIVDDSPEVCEYFKDIATSIGMKCKSAYDGFEACKILANDSDYQIIFVDWKMPEMDGIELTRVIRARYGQQAIVIMISAVAWPQIEEEAKAAGVDRFIAKPLLPSLIIDCINECLGCKGLTCNTANRSFETNVDLFQGKHILLAEDIEINREILITLLAETGVAIDIAENGKIACEMLENNSERYDLILMDIHMPEMDGYQATQNIRAMTFEKAKSVPIIAMTANVFKEDIERCLASGMNDHVGKPLDIEEIMSKLTQYFY